MDYIVCGVAKSWTRLSDLYFLESVLGRLTVLVESLYVTTYFPLRDAATSY